MSQSLGTALSWTFLAVSYAIAAWVTHVYTRRRFANGVGRLKALAVAVAGVPVVLLVSYVLLDVLEGIAQWTAGSAQVATKWTYFELVHVAGVPAYVVAMFLFLRRRGG